MRHITPKFRTNQRISCDFVCAGVIKGLRFQGEPKLSNKDNRFHFRQPEWEYLIYRLMENDWLAETPWGWVKESEIYGGQN